MNPDRNPYTPPSSGDQDASSLVDPIKKPAPAANIVKLIAGISIMGIALYLEYVSESTMFWPLLVLCIFGLCAWSGLYLYVILMNRKMMKILKEDERDGDGG